MPKRQELKPQPEENTAWWNGGTISSISLFCSFYYLTFKGFFFVFTLSYFDFTFVVL